MKFIILTATSVLKVVLGLSLSSKNNIFLKANHFVIYTFLAHITINMFNLMNKNLIK